ncbi:MAG: ATP-binding cassette domain-containing protein [Gammaproteobacteria bacterium]|nr:ATP-binding cassette domain-containing protein [Gammaproteobacteria bacterium]
MEDKPIVSIQNLTTHYDDVKILDDINLHVNHNEILVIMGGSGSGKSTLLRHMLGLNKPSFGDIELFGLNLKKMAAQDLCNLRQKIGVSFQGGALFNSMTVGENIQLPLKEHTRLDDKTMQIMMRMKLEVVNLAGFENLMPDQLSGGMIKRVALARAIVMDPALLFFDEPSAGLDPVVSAELDELILRLKDAMKMSIVVVTHEVESAMKIADRIAVLNKGKLVQIGSKEEIKHSENPTVKKLINRIPDNIQTDSVEYLDRLTRENDI